MGIGVIVAYSWATAVGQGATVLLGSRREIGTALIWQGFWCGELARSSTRGWTLGITNCAT